MKKISLITILTLLFLKGFSQEESVYGSQNTKNSVYGSLGINPGAFYIPLNFNYERNILETNFANFNGKAGIGLWEAWTEFGLDFPLTVQTVFFKKTSHLELGIGGQYIYDFAGNISGLSHLLNIAYRFQRSDGNFLFKIGAEKNRYVSYPFFSLGYAF